MFSWRLSVLVENMAPDAGMTVEDSPAAVAVPEIAVLETHEKLAKR